MLCADEYSEAKYYGKVFSKVKDDPQYPLNEKHRLEAIIAKGTTAQEKYGPYGLSHI